VPQLYGNISRFFLGINNDYKRHYGSAKLENVKCMRFSYKGRVRLLLYTSKPIQAGETLYFNYNGSNYEYPTDHFVT
jgi:[histone H3]-lysine27 N-methyltransferase